MNGLYRFFITLFITLVIAGCAPPIGSLGNPGANDALWAVPNRQIYDINDIFLRDADLQIFASIKGRIKLISNNLVSISVVEDPMAVPPVSVPVPNAGDGYFIFTRPGRNIIEISYNGLHTHYSVEVQDPHGLGGNGGNGYGNGTGIIIEWK